jgi:glycosyltransferase involved in cell wall biosynthesis
MLRLGLVCDFADEGWPSMDLVGEMLRDHLQRDHHGAFRTDQFRPVFRRRATALGALKSSQVAWNGDRLWNRAVEYPLWLRKRMRDYDLFHIVDHSYAHLALSLPAERTVVTCHDVDAFRSLTHPEAGPRPLWYRAMTKRILKGLRSAQRVVFVSEAMRGEADRLGLIPASRSSVVHNGVWEAKFDADAEREADGLLGASSAGLLILSVASTIPRKRIDTLLRVFAGIVKENPGARLVRVGGSLTGPQMDMAQELGVGASIIHLPFLSRALLGAVYRRATLLLQPSDAEGFGLPVVEAMAHGCPVIATDLPALREVGGEAAIYAPAGDVAAWITAANALLVRRSEPAFWNDLCGRSMENAKRFSWRESADRMASVYQEVAREAAAIRSRRCSSCVPAASAVPSKAIEKRPIAFGHER